LQQYLSILSAYSPVFGQIDWIDSSCSKRLLSDLVDIQNYKLVFFPLHTTTTTMNRLLSLAIAAATLPLGAVLSYAPLLPQQGVRFSPNSPTAVSMSTTSRVTFASSKELLTQNNNKKNGVKSNQKSREPDDNKIKIEEPTWQACVDELLDPITSLTRRQELLGKLVNANKDIQESVLTALRDRKVRFIRRHFLVLILVFHPHIPPIVYYAVPPTPD
jgi:hypothetical protein